MRLLRNALNAVGFGLLAVFWVAELLLRRRDGVKAAPALLDVDQLTGAAAPKVSRAVPRTRLVVGAVGVAVAVYGLIVVLRTVPWATYVGIAIWLVGAVVLHDAVLVPAVSVLRVATHKVGGRLPGPALALLKAGFVVGGVLSLIALPEIWAKRRGPLNPSVLPGSYAQALLVTWLVLAILTVGSVALIAVIARRQTVREAS